MPCLRTLHYYVFQSNASSRFRSLPGHGGQAEPRMRYYLSEYAVTQVTTFKKTQALTISSEFCSYLAVQQGSTCTGCGWRGLSSFLFFGSQ